MKLLEQIKKPSKSDQKIAGASYDALASILEQLKIKQPEIEIEDTSEKIKIPISALELLSDILKVMASGKLISVVPITKYITTQEAAAILGCSRPHIVKLLEHNFIAFTKVGKHRRVKVDDVLKYKIQVKKQQRQNIIDIMHLDEATGLYD